MPNLLILHDDADIPTELIDGFSAAGISPLLIETKALGDQVDLDQQMDFCFIDSTRNRDIKKSLGELRRHLPHLPLIIAVNDTDRSEEMAAIPLLLRVIPLPVVLDELVTLVLNTWRAHLYIISRAAGSTSGEITRESLLSLINTFAETHEDAQVSLQTHEQVGRLAFARGKLLAAHFANLEGEAAMRKLALLDRGTFEIEFSRPQVKTNLSLSAARLNQLILQRQKEADFQLMDLPDVNTKLYAISRFHADDFSALQITILRSLVTGRSLRELFSSSDVDDLEIIPEIRELLAASRVFTDQDKRDAEDEKHKGLGRLLSAFGFVQESKDEAPRTVVSRKKAHEAPPGYKRRFAQAQLKELQDKLNTIK
jgi:hypothetical protein